MYVCNVCMYACMYVCMCVCVCVCVYLSITYVRIYIYTHTYICAYIYIYICTYVHIYIYIYIDTHTRTYVHRCADKRVNSGMQLALEQKYAFCVKQSLTACKAKCKILRLNTKKLSQVSTEKAFKVFRKNKMIMAGSTKSDKINLRG